MTELTLEALAKRLEAVERELAEQRAQRGRKKDWRRTVGMFEDSEFARDMIAETLAIREVERKAAREEEPIIVEMPPDQPEQS